MRLVIKYRVTIAVMLLIAALLPYLIVCFYALPYADDFCCGWTAAAHISFLQKFLNEYLYWNDRYSADIITNIQPLVTGQLLVYQFALFGLLIFMVVVVLFFIRYWVENFLAALLITLLAVVFFLCYEPNLTEGTYWYTGLANYQIGNIFLLLHLGLFFRLLSSQNKMARIFLAVFSFITLVVACGFSEVGAVLIPVYYIAGIFLSSKIQFKQRRIIFFHASVAVISVCFVFFSPGHFVRLGLFPNSFNIPHSLLYSTLQTIRFTAKWCFSFPFLFLSLLVIHYSDEIQNKFIRQTDYRLILLLILGTVFTASFLPYMATGILGQHRTINYAFFYFIFLWLWLLISLSEKFSLKEELPWLQIPTIRIFIFSLSLLVLAFSGNGFRMLVDFKDDNFSRYNVEFQQRQNYIVAHPLEPIQPLKLIPNTFTITDAKGDTTWWVDKCMGHYYRETGLVLR